MKKKLISLLLALVMCLGLMPVGVSAAQTDLPDWYFLFAAFKNIDTDCADRDGKMQHVTYSMSQEEVDLIRDLAAEFEEYMNSVGVMRAHVDVVEIDEPVTELAHRDGNSSLLRAEQATPLLEGKVDLNRYDHVTCFLDLSIWTGYAGITPAPFENGTGISCINHHSWEYIRDYYRARTDKNIWHIQLYIHEFLHFGERLNGKWGGEFILHRDGKTHYTDEDEWETYATDAILNRVNEPDVFPEGGTGVHPLVWQYPPHVIRGMTEWNIPSGVTNIGNVAFANNTTLTKVTIPGTVTSIGVSAFYDCTGLTEVNILPGVTTIEGFAFRGCSNLTRMSIPASVTRIGDVAIGNVGNIKDIYYSGTEAQWKAIQVGEQNNKLSRATIHYNHLMADVKTNDWFAQPVLWAVEKGITAGSGNGGFSPNATCTQGQILTFLWRAKGSPEPKGAVTGSEYYAVPLQWATEQGLVDKSLSAKAPCTRADVVTYLWKLAGSPKAGASSFTDVPSNAAYAPAVSWAVEKGVTGGTSETTFSPDKTCTRGQIVTFLYAALAG